MSETLPIRCACGQVRGHVDVVPGGGQRLVCYCDDCQAYGRFLGRDDVLDARGGTDIWQTRPSLVRITEGELASMRLSDRGMIRWYARCCRTPIANTMVSAGAPFVGMHQRCIGDADGRRRDDVLGAPIAKVQGRFAIGGVPEGVAPTVGVGTIARTLLMLARSALARGATPSPFFDAHTKKPRIEPEVLSAAARDALR
ncbi:DUF6151 family protein [Sandaracinus amylolyticus]|uniref:CENP-V/GFA domain-containing protein n=1 Tax=Sandaracinus amylolyticus TaxID=927083 RepID=A0A0F6YHB7_9BACT|nr:DUF6151 family protein [Sandaracinus amylolyticus]AKF04588.1 Hypothetical protein DB32_001737 [Sandaracinus amylolyticus]